MLSLSGLDLVRQSVMPRVTSQSLDDGCLAISKFSIDLFIKFVPPEKIIRHINCLFSLAGPRLCLRHYSLSII